MNLHGIAGPIIAAVNPTVSISLQHSTGYATSASGKQTPAYAAAVDGPAQVQPVSADDLKHLNNLNIQGNFKSIYLYGTWYGIVRADVKGGDLVVLPDGSKWLVVVQAEEWPDWCRVIVCQQV